jgi:hypothetical protein
MRTRINNRKQVRYIIWLVFTLFLLFGYSSKNALGTVYHTLTIQSYAYISSPCAVLRNGADNISIVYTNGTSAKIIVDATSEYVNYSHALNITNIMNDCWKVKLTLYDNQNITRISNATISLHNGTDTPIDQIIIENGSIAISEGDFCNLLTSETIYIKISNLKEATSGVSYIYVHLRIQKPNTSTYSLYPITFKFT